jgi:hypothetical protein
MATSRPELGVRGQNYICFGKRQLSDFWLSNNPSNTLYKTQWFSLNNKSWLKIKLPKQVLP